MENIPLFSRTHSTGVIYLSCSNWLIRFVGVGFTNGQVKILDALNLLDEPTEPFRYAHDTITHMCFSHDSNYLATAVCEGYFTYLPGFLGARGKLNCLHCRVMVITLDCPYIVCTLRSKSF